MRASFLFVAALCAAPLLAACTQDQNASNSERDTHMGATRVSPLPPPLPEVPAVAAVVVPAPAAAPAAASASASASAPAHAPAHAPAPKHP